MTKTSKTTTTTTISKTKTNTMITASLLIVSICGVSGFQQQQQQQQIGRSSISRRRIATVHSPSSSSSSSSSSALPLLFDDDRQEDDSEEEEQGIVNSNRSNSNNMSRRNIFENSAKALLIGITTPFLPLPTPLTTPVESAEAMLLQFPIISTPTMRSKIGDGTMTQEQQLAAQLASPQHQSRTLKNTYHFIRAGQSELEKEGIYSTNPLFLTNRENALAPEGFNCLQKSLKQLKAASSQMQPTIVFHSLAANSMDTGDYIATELQLGRDRLLPEFTYLDQRGIGLWDSSNIQESKPAIWALDSMEAGQEGFKGRPPANTDGTPNDTLHDQFTRLRQFLSLQETRSSGETILVIFPDGTGPALLSCMMAGIPFEDVHALDYAPGELRLDVTPESIRDLYEKRRYDHEYLDVIADGKIKLKELRSKDPKSFATSYKDSMIQKDEDDTMSTEFQAKQKEEAVNKIKLEEEKRAALEESIQRSRLVAQEKKNAQEQFNRELQEKKQRQIVERQQQFEDRKAEKKKKQEELTAVFEAAKLKKEEAKERLREENALLMSEQQRRQERDLESTSSEASESLFTPPSLSNNFGLSPDVLSKVAFGTLGAIVTAGAVISNEIEDAECELDDEEKCIKKTPPVVPITTKKYKEFKDDPLIGGVNVNAAAAAMAAVTTATAAAAVDAVTAAAANVTTAAPTVTATSTHTNNIVDERFVKKKDKNSRGTHKKNDVPITTKKYKEFRDEPLVAVNAHAHVAGDADAAVDEKKDGDGVEEELEKLATAEQQYKKGLKEVAENNKKKLQEQLQQEQQRDRTTPTMRSKSSLYDTPLPPVTITKASIETSLVAETTDDDDTAVEDEYVDDEGDWLRVLHDIGSDTYDEGQYDDEEDDWTGNISKKKNKDQMIGAAVFDNDNNDNNNDEDDDDDDEKVGWNPPSGSTSKKSKILGAAVFDNYEEEEEKIGWNPPSNNSQKKKEILGAAVFDNYEEEVKKVHWNPPSGNSSKKKEILGAAVFDNYEEEEATIAWNPPSTNTKKKKEILGAAVFDNE